MENNKTLPHNDLIKEKHDVELMTQTQVLGERASILKQKSIYLGIFFICCCFIGGYCIWVHYHFSFKIIPQLLEKDNIDISQMNSFNTILNIIWTWLPTSLIAFVLIFKGLFDFDKKDKKPDRQDNFFQVLAKESAAESASSTIG